MATLQHTYSSKIVATCIFAMTFLLTPRVMVEPGADSIGQPGAHEMIPVQTLQEPDGDCLWCEPLQPVRCEDDGGEESLQGPGKKLWLNPDEPPSSRPCVPLEHDPDAPRIDDGPSA